MSLLFETWSRPFQTLNFQLPRSEAIKVFRLFDSVCELFDSGHDFWQVDQVIDQFVGKSKTPLINAALRFANLNVDSRKYQDRTNQKFNIHSYQYFGGLYEYIQPKFLQSDQTIAFLHAMDQCHQWVKKQVQPMLDEIEKKIKIATALKVWKHQSFDENPHFLPLHCDRTVFTIVVHTENEGKEALRIYPPKSAHYSEQEIEKLEPVIPAQSDFPLMIPGIYAKPYFSCEPIPHCVVSDGSSQKRYSLVFFIARFEGW
jgi:hypothetical protein